MPRGQKICPSCSAINGPRAYTCKGCGSDFAFKPKSKEVKNTKIIKNINWKELVKGDRIKVRGGPYYVHKGEFIPMGYRGRFVVDCIDDKGIRAFGVDKHGGFAHIYMGGDIQNKETGVWKIAHEIVKLKNREVVE